MMTEMVLNCSEWQNIDIKGLSSFFLREKKQTNDVLFSNYYILVLY